MATRRRVWHHILTRILTMSLLSLVFVDETYLRTHMTRHYGRAPRGQRVSYRMRSKSKRYTLIGAMGMDGMKARWVIGRGMSEKDWVKWVKEYLVPTLDPGRILIWDNLKQHSNQEALDALKEAGCFVLFQPPYSPDFNPIEKAWSKLKELVRGYQVRGAKELRRAVDRAWGQITTEDIRGFFKHCGMVEQTGKASDELSEARMDLAS